MFDKAVPGISYVRKFLFAAPNHGVKQKSFQTNRWTVRSEWRKVHKNIGTSRSISRLQHCRRYYRQNMSTASKTESLQKKKTALQKCLLHTKRISHTIFLFGWNKMWLCLIKEMWNPFLIPKTAVTCYFYIIIQSIIHSHFPKEQKFLQVFGCKICINRQFALRPQNNEPPSRPVSEPANGSHSSFKCITQEPKQNALVAAHVLLLETKVKV